MFFAAHFRDIKNIEFLICTKFFVFWSVKNITRTYLSLAFICANHGHPCHIVGEVRELSTLVHHTFCLGKSYHCIVKPLVNDDQIELRNVKSEPRIFSGAICKHHGKLMKIQEFEIGGKVYLKFWHGHTCKQVMEIIPSWREEIEQTCNKIA